MKDVLFQATMEEVSTSNPASSNWNELLKKKEEFANLPVPQDWKGWFAYKFIEVGLPSKARIFVFRSRVLVLFFDNINLNDINAFSFFLPCW